MTPDDRLLGQLQASVYDLQQGQDKLFEKSDAAAETLAEIKALLTSYHTPLTCPHATAIDDLKGYKNKLLGIAAVLSAFVALAAKWVWDRVTGGG